MKEEKLQISTGFSTHYDAIQQLAHSANAIVGLMETPVAEGESISIHEYDALVQVRQNLDGIVKLAWEWACSVHEEKEGAGK